MKGVLDIVIAHLNYEYWGRNVKSLIRNTPEGVIRRIFFIDQHEDRHHLWDKKADPWVTMIHTRNLGFAKAMNTGIRLSDAPYIMCLNDDVTFLNKRWWPELLKVFEQVPNALCVNPASIQDPDGRGGKVIMDGFEFKENYDDEEYERAVRVKGHGWIDGICMWGPVFRREILDKIPGTIPGKAWFDEMFFPGGGEDYDLNRRAFLSGYRCLGAMSSIVWHDWYMTKKPGMDEYGVKHDGGMFVKKWTNPETGEEPDIYGKTGRKDIPLNELREGL